MAAALQRMAAGAGKCLSSIPVVLMRNGQRFLPYAKAELMPPTPGEFGEVARGFSNVVKGFTSSSWRNLTVKQAWLNTLVAADCVFFFFIGECIGKGSIIGYAIPGAMHFEMIEGGANSSEAYFKARYPDWAPPVEVERDYDH